MRNVCVQVFAFNELVERAQKRAIESRRELLNSNFDHRATTELFEEQLKELGYPVGDIRWSLSSCQGDGVAFYGKIPDLQKVTKRLLDQKAYRRLQRLLAKGEITFTIDCLNWRYSHAYTMGVSKCEYLYLSARAEKRAYELLDYLEACILDDIQKVSRKLEKLGYDEIEYQSSDEYVSEEIMENDLEYLANGETFFMG